LRIFGGYPYPALHRPRPVVGRWPPSGLARRLNSRFLRLTVENFRTLTRMDLPLGPLTVLVGPNAVGKSNVLRAFEFLGDVARAGIEPTVETLSSFSVASPE
jgi:hypothetical protein